MTSTGPSTTPAAPVGPAQAPVEATAAAEPGRDVVPFGQAVKAWFVVDGGQVEPAGRRPITAAHHVEAVDQHRR
jgi:hypothetical protein